MRYLLDTCIISAVMRQPDGPAAERLRGMTEEDEVFTSYVVLAELEAGLVKKPSKPRRENLERILDKLPVLPLDWAVLPFYAAARAELEGLGRVIGGNDFWIAAHAMALDAVLVTDNVREFSRISGLKLENWLRVSPETD